MTALRNLWRAFVEWFKEPTDYYCRACRREGNSFVERDACTIHREDER